MPVSRWVEFGTLLIALLAVIRIGCELPARAGANDFAHYYIAGRLQWAGANPYGQSLAPLYAQFGFELDSSAMPVVTPNPPAFVWLFAPIAALPVRVAFGVWLLVQVGSLGGILWMTQRLLADRLPPWGWRCVWAGTLAAVPVFWHFYFSQAQLLLAALVLGAFVMQRAGRDTAAGLLVVTAGLLKIFPLALLPWFIWRGAGTWRRRLTRLGWVVGFGLVIVWATNLERWEDFFHRQGSVVSGNMIDRVFNVTVPSLVTNVGLTAGPESMARVWPAVGLGAGLLVLAGAYAACWRADGARELEFSLLCAAMLAGSPTAWGHYLVFLIFPVVVLATRVRPRRWVGFAVVVALLNNFGRWNFMLQESALRGHIWVKLLLNYVPLFGILGLAVFLISELYAGRRRLDE